MCVYLLYIYIYEIYCHLFHTLSVENPLTAAGSTGRKADRPSAPRLSSVSQLCAGGILTSGYGATSRHTRTDCLCLSLLKKVKCTLVQALRHWTGRTARRGSGGRALIFLDHGTRRGWGAASRPGRYLLPGKTRYPLYRRLVGPRASQDRCGKSRPRQRFDRRTVQPVASCYTNYATRPTQLT